MKYNQYSIIFINLIMNSSKFSQKQLEKKYEALYKEEVKFSVLTAIEWYGSLNLMQISRIIGKSESATYRHVKSLLENNVISLDPEKTATLRGKFYCLNPKLSTISKKTKMDIGGYSNRFKQDMEQYDNLLNEVSELEFMKIGLTKLAERIGDDSIAENIKRYSLVVNNIITSIINELARFEKKLKEAINEDKLEELIENERKLVNITQNIFLIKASKIEHVLKINRVLSDCYDQLNTLKQEIELELQNHPKVQEPFAIFKY